VTWIDLAQDWDEWGTNVNTVTIPEGLVKHWEFLA